MERPKYPIKEQVQGTQANQQTRQKPAPDMKQIRRELGWGFIELARSRN